MRGSSMSRRVREREREGRSVVRVALLVDALLERAARRVRFELGRAHQAVPRVVVVDTRGKQSKAIPAVRDRKL
jgi:hypothetical protein